jgi:hypothetical protein
MRNHLPRNNLEAQGGIVIGSARLKTIGQNFQPAKIAR